MNSKLKHDNIWFIAYVPTKPTLLAKYRAKTYPTAQARASTPWYAHTVTHWLCWTPCKVSRYWHTLVHIFFLIQILIRPASSVAYAYTHQTCVNSLSQKGREEKQTFELTISSQQAVQDKVSTINMKQHQSQHWQPHVLMYLFPAFSAQSLSLLSGGTIFIITFNRCIQPYYPCNIHHYRIYLLWKQTLWKESGIENTQRWLNECKRIICLS